MKAEDLLIILFCEVDDWVRAHPPPPRPGPAPRFGDSEVLTLALARELLGVDSERRFHRQVRDEWAHLFPRLPPQSELNRRTRWLWGALEGLRRHWLRRLPPPAGNWYSFDTTPLPVKGRSRARGAGQWVLPGGTAAGFGWCAAKKEWFFGFRVALLGALDGAVPSRWAVVPAAANEREALEAQLEGLADLGVLADRGLSSAPLTAALAARGVTLLTPPPRAARARTPAIVRRFVRAHRNRVESGINTAKDQLHLERHRAHTPWGLLTRLAAKFAAATIRCVLRRAGHAVE